MRPLDPASDALIELLIRSTFPQARDQPITRFTNGLDNDMIAVGDRWLARMPRRDLGVELLAREISVLPALPDLGLGKPVLVAVGEAIEAYPTRFLLLERLPGAQPAPEEAFGAEDARRLAHALRTLHGAAPPEGLPGDVLGLLAVERFPKRLEQTLPNLRPEDRARYEEPLRNLLQPSFEPLDGTRAWVHGDLHIRNVLRHEGKLSAIIDWGDSHIGHPALDFASAFALFDPPEREVFFEAYGSTSAPWREAGRRRGAVTALVLLVLATQAEDEAGKALARASLERCLKA